MAKSNQDQIQPLSLTPSPNPSPNPSNALRWNVLVRHSTFLLKQAVVEATTPQEARTKFLKLVEERHEAQARRQKGPEAEKAAQAVRDSFQHAMKNIDSLEWDIRDAEVVEKQRQEIKQAQERAREKADRK